MFAIAKQHSPQHHALISLLLVGALRIQDAVGLTFEQVTKLRPGRGNVRVLKLQAKKTTAREVQITPDVVESVKAYQQSSGMRDDQVMFESGTPDNPTSRWIMSLKRFYREHDIDVQSHDFRTTMITEYYNNCKDLVKTK